MAETSGERKRKRAIAKATKIRDALLTAQATLPSLVAELNDLLGLLAPPSEEESKGG